MWYTTNSLKIVQLNHLSHTHPTILWHTTMTVINSHKLGYPLFFCKRPFRFFLATSRVTFAQLLAPHTHEKLKNSLVLLQCPTPLPVWHIAPHYFYNHFTLQCFSFQFLVACSNFYNFLKLCKWCGSESMVISGRCILITNTDTENYDVHEQICEIKIVISSVMVCRAWSFS